MIASRPFPRIPALLSMRGPLRVSIFGIFLGASACTTGGVLSSGASLPQAGLNFGNNELGVAVTHDCSGGRCTEIKAHFENKTAAPIELVVAGARLTRAGQGLALSRVGEAKGNVVIPARDSVSLRFQPIAEGGKQAMSYVMPTEVWCSMKVDAQCKSPDQGAAKCAGFARYYFDTYVSTKGWVSLTFPYKADGRSDALTSPAPEFMGNAPVVKVVEDGKAPRFGADPDDIVFHRISCDEKCRCTDVTRPRNYFLDDKFKPHFID